MSFLHPVLSLPPGVLLSASGILIILFALWLSALFSRRHFVTIRRSEETELIAFELRRIADAVERLVSVREGQQAQAQAPVEAPASRTVGLSMFGR